MVLKRTPPSTPIATTTTTTTTTSTATMPAGPGLATSAGLISPPAQGSQKQHSQTVPELMETGVVGTSQTLLDIHVPIQTPVLQPNQNPPSKKRGGSPLDPEGKRVNFDGDESDLEGDSE